MFPSWFFFSVCCFLSKWLFYCQDLLIWLHCLYNLPLYMMCLRFQRFPEDSWFPLTLAKPSVEFNISAKGGSLCSFEAAIENSRTKARSHQLMQQSIQVGEWAMSQVQLLGTVLCQVKHICLLCWAATCVPEVRVKRGLDADGPNQSVHASTFRIVSYGELDPTGEQGAQFHFTWREAGLLWDTGHLHWRSDSECSC